MGKEILTFRKFKIEKNKFYCHKAAIFLKAVDTEKLLVSNKIFFGEKRYFIGYLYNDHKVKSLHIMLPETNAYVKNL